jgi:hypothetical protein
LQTPGDRRLADHLLTEGFLQSALNVTDRQAAQEAADDQRLQRMRARDALAEHLAGEPNLAGVADPWALDHGRAARRRDRAGLGEPVAIDHSLAAIGALVAIPADERGDLVLQRLLQDQPRAKPRDRLDRVLFLGDAVQDIVKLAAQPVARDYLLHAGVPPSASSCRTKRRLRPPYVSPGQRDGTRSFARRRRRWRC